MVFNMLSMDDIYKSGIDDDLEEGEIIDDSNESINQYNEKCQSSPLDNFVEDEVIILSDKKPMGINNALPILENLHQSRLCPPNQMSNLHQSRLCPPNQMSTVHSKSQDNIVSNWKNSPQKCKRNSFKSNKYYRKRSPSVSSLSNCSCSSCYSTSSGESKKQLKGDYHSSRKESRTSQEKKEHRLLPQMKNPYFLSVHSKESSRPRYSKKMENALKLRKKHSRHHSTAYSNVADGSGKGMQILQTHSQNMHYNVPKKKGDLNLYPLVSKDKQLDKVEPAKVAIGTLDFLKDIKLRNSANPRVAIGTLDFLKDIKLRNSAKPKVIPGSLGEMLLKNQLKSKLKTTDSPNLDIQNHPQSHSLLKQTNTNIENNQSDIVNLESAQNCTGQIEAENDDEEDELTLRYKALQSAVKCSNTNSSAYSDLNKVLAAAKATLDENVKVVDSEICTKKMQKIPTLGANDAKDNFEFFCDNQTAKDKCEPSMIDMEISNDSITECHHSQEEQKSNLKFDINSHHFSDKMKCNAMSQDTQFPFPIEWAYMIPPPAQPDQPDNNLTSVNSWCFNQNMFMQSMEETAPGQEVSNDLHYHTKVPTSQSYNTYNHHYQVPYQPTKTSSHLFLSNVDDKNSQVGFSYQQLSNQTTQNTQLRDGHAEQYQTFMSSVLHNSHPGLFNRKDKYQNLVQIDLKPLGKSQSPSNSIAHSKPLNSSLPNKRKMRRRRRSMRKNLLDGAKSSTIIQPKPSIINSSSLKTSNLENITIEDDEDEDILRAQLLNDMALKNKFLLTEKNENEIQNVEAQNQRRNLHPPSPVTTFFKKKKMPLKTVSSFSVKQSRKWLKTEVSTAVDKASKQTRKNATKLDIGGRYLDPKNRFYDAPHTDGFSLSKFPPVKPVIISLVSSESDRSEDEKITTEGKIDKDCENVISGIFELIKSCRNSQVKPLNTERESSNGPTPKGVRHLSKERQEEYRKLRTLLLHKKKMIQMRKKVALKADLVKNPQNTSLIPLVQPGSESLNENLGPCVDSQLDQIQDINEANNYENTAESPVPLQGALTSQLELLGDHTQEICARDECQGSGELEMKSNSTLEDVTTSENMSEGLPLIDGEPSINIASPLVEIEEIPLSQADVIWSPIEEYSDHLYSKPNKEVTESAEHKIVPSALALEKNNASFSLEINECAGEKINVLSQEIDDEDESSSSSYESSSSSSSEDSDSECAIDQIEIELRNKLLQKRQMLLTHEQTVCSTDALFKDDQNETLAKNAFPQAPLESKSYHQRDDQEYNVVSPCPVNIYSALVEEVGLEQCSHATPHSSEPESNLQFSIEIDKEPRFSDEQISLDFQRNLKVKNKMEDSLQNETLQDENGGPIINSSSNFDLTMQLDNPAKTASSPVSKATAIALIKSLKDADLKTRIMRGEQKKNLKKQIEEEIKKKDMSKRMFTSHICTLFQEAVMDDNMCQSHFTRMVKLFSQIDNLQSERKEKISALTVTLAKTTKLIHKLEEDIHALTQLQRLRNQVMSSDDENPFIPSFNLTADEEQHKSFLLQMNTLRQNLQLNLAQEQLLTKTISNRFNSRPSHRNRSRKEYLARRPAPANSTARKFKVDRRPLSQRQTKRSLEIVMTPQSISSPVILPWAGRQTAKLPPPQHKEAHIRETKKACSPLEHGTSTSLHTDDERDKSVGDLGILCPHDLLGRCNDDFCVYQHTASSGGQVRGDSNVLTASPPSDSQLAPMLFDKQIDNTQTRVSSPELLSHMETKHPLNPVFRLNEKKPAEEATTSCGENGASGEENRNDLSPRNETQMMLKNSPEVLAQLFPPEKRSLEESSIVGKSKKVCNNSVKEDSVQLTNHSEEIVSIPQETSSTSIDASCPNLTEITTDYEVTKTMNPDKSMHDCTHLRRKRCRSTAPAKRLRKSRIRSRRPVRLSRRIREKLHKY